MRTTENKLSWTVIGNTVFLVLWVATQIANNFGYGAFQPSPELLIIAPALVAVINILIRYYHTRAPIAGSPYALKRKAQDEELFGRDVTKPK